MSNVITKVWLDETECECTKCHACEDLVPEVFVVPDKMTVLANAKLSMISDIEDAAVTCPVGTIAVEYNNSGKRDN